MLEDVRYRGVDEQVLIFVGPPLQVVSLPEPVAMAVAVDGIIVESEETVKRILDRVHNSLASVVEKREYP